LDRVAFDGNVATDGGALFVDLLGDLSISRSTLSNNVAYRNGGGLSVGAIATAKIYETEGVNNHAVASGGMAHFAGIMSADLGEVSAIGNTAGSVGGAFAMFDSLRTVSHISNSSISVNNASSKGGGLYIEDAAVNIHGTQLQSNAVEQGDGGAAATSGDQAELSFSDMECVAVEVILDWGTAGKACPAHDYYSDGRLMTCDGWAMTCGAFMATYGDDHCSGCACNK
jgi:hypothetical protein